MMAALRFESFDSLLDRPHAVVDGSSGPATRLLLSHWPGSATPAELAADLSAQIAFKALERPGWLQGLEVVSTNHFDQDGLASAYALIAPDDATQRRARVIDVARAGDFATWADRDSARVSMVIAAYDDPARSPLGAAALAGSYEERCAALYENVLPRMTELLDHPERSRSLWEEEDAFLQASLDAIQLNVITIDEMDGVDLAVVTVPESWARRADHRFSQARQHSIHPMAVNRATEAMTVMTVEGSGIEIEQRYETWVMYKSRLLRRRQDLRILAAELNSLEPGGAAWRADPPNALTPGLKLASGSSWLSVRQVVEVAERFFATALPAWDPFKPETKR